MRSKFCADPGGEPKVASVPGQLLSHGSDGEHRDPVPLACVYQPRHVVHRLGLELAADEYLDGDGAGVDPCGVLHAHRDMLVGQFLEDAGAAAGPQHDGRARRGRHRRTDHAPGGHQRVRERQQRDDGQVDPLQACSGSLEIPVIDGEHHRAAGGWPEYAGQPALHAPVQAAAAFERKGMTGRGHFRAEACATGVIIGVGHDCCLPVAS